MTSSVGLEDDQGMLPPTYDDSVLYDAAEDAGNETLAGDPTGVETTSSDTKVTVTDPAVQQSESSTFKTTFVMYTVRKP